MSKQKLVINTIYIAFTGLVSFLLVGVGLQLIYIEWLYKYKPVTVITSRSHPQPNIQGHVT